MLSRDLTSTLYTFRKTGHRYKCRNIVNVYIFNVCISMYVCIYTYIILYTLRICIYIYIIYSLHAPSCAACTRE